MSFPIGKSPVDRVRRLPGGFDGSRGSPVGTEQRFDGRREYRLRRWHIQPHRGKRGGTDHRGLRKLKRTQTRLARRCQMKRIESIRRTNPVFYRPLEYSSQVLPQANGEALFLEIAIRGAHAIRTVARRNAHGGPLTTTA
ncbi:MAG TPA: hypothetical protein VLZ30_12940 [Verrucomicrobiae bacterium]|nr:hypothetical protein [Verrucomicrobiae bacterium]